MRSLQYIHLQWEETRAVSHSSQRQPRPWKSRKGGPPPVARPMHYLLRLAHQVPHLNVDNPHREKGKLTMLSRVLRIFGASKWSTAVPCPGEVTHSSHVLSLALAESDPMVETGHSLSAVFWKSRTSCGLRL